MVTGSQERAGVGSIPTELPLKTTEWYVVFTPRLSQSWWYIFTTKEISHCFAFCQDGPDVIVFDRLTAIDFTIRRNITCNELAEIYRKEFNFPVLIVTTTQPLRLKHYGFLTCVSFVKALLGISSWSFLPQALYRTLLKNYNAIEVK